MDFSAKSRLDRNNLPDYCIFPSSEENVNKMCRFWSNYLIHVKAIKESKKKKKEKQNEQKSGHIQEVDVVHQMYGPVSPVREKNVGGE